MDAKFTQRNARNQRLLLERYARQPEINNQKNKKYPQIVKQLRYQNPHRI